MDLTALLVLLALALSGLVTPVRSFRAFEPGREPGAGHVLMQGRDRYRVRPKPVISAAATKSARNAFAAWAHAFFSNISRMRGATDS